MCKTNLRKQILNSLGLGHLGFEIYNNKVSKIYISLYMLTRDYGRITWVNYNIY